MYSDKIRRNLYKIFIIVIFLCISIFYVESRVIKFVDDVHYENIEKKLNTRTEAYKIQLERQMQSDVQTLRTIASFLKLNEINNLSNLHDILHEANKNNHFMLMISIYEDGKGIKSIISQKEASYINVDDMEPELKELYKKSLSGETMVSDVFYSEDVRNDVVAISVPIYSEDEKTIEGVLIAYDTSDQFAESLNISIKSDEEKNYINLIESNGTFIVRSTNRLNENEAENIYNMGISLLDENQVKSALSNGEDYYSLFNLDNTQYGVYFKRLDYKDWYVFLINPIEVEADNIVRILNITKLTFTLIIVIIISFTLIFYIMSKKSNNMLIKLAYYDELTGAYNSNKFRNICEYILKSQNDYSIVVFNIKKFKFINNIFGEKWADELLCYIKEVLDRNTYKNEYYCRDNSDQFFIFIKSIDKDEILKRVNKIKSDIQNFSSINNQNCDITIYGGVCSYIDLHDTSTIYKTMLDNALFIMKEKKENKESFIFYDESIYKKRYKQNYIENNMHTSLKNNEFKLFLQPKVDSRTKEVIAAEALVRWIRDDGKMIYPNEFIPLFEENGFCENLDLYMIEKACEKIRSWIDVGIEPIPISINQSKLSFYKSNYIDSICEITRKYNVPNSFIGIEILEGLALDNITDFNNTIEKLHEKGFRVSMDDFGSGYSSLNILSKLKIDELKIDGEFLLKMGNDIEFKNKQKVILSSIIGLAKKLNLQTVVEGVEDESHLKFIDDLGYDMAQGYYFSRPLDEKSFDDKYMN